MSNQQISFEGYACRAWGETDFPCVEVVRDLDGVKAFLVREWLGTEDKRNYSGDLMLPVAVAEIEAHDFQNEGEWRAEFEIGGVSVEQVYSFAALQAAPQPSPSARTYMDGYSEGKAWALEEIAKEFDRRAVLADGSQSVGWYEPGEPAQVVRNIALKGGA